MAVRLGTLAPSTRPKAVIFAAMTAFTRRNRKAAYGDRRELDAPPESSNRLPNAPHNPAPRPPAGFVLSAAHRIRYQRRDLRKLTPVGCRFLSDASAGDRMEPPPRYAALHV